MIEVGVKFVINDLPDWRGPGEEVGTLPGTSGLFCSCCGVAIMMTYCGIHTTREEAARRGWTMDGEVDDPDALDWCPACAPVAARVGPRALAEAARARSQSARGGGGARGAGASGGVP